MFVAEYGVRACPFGDTLCAAPLRVAELSEARRDRSICGALMAQQQRQPGQRKTPLDKIAEDADAREFGQQIARQQTAHSRPDSAPLGRIAKVAEHFRLAAAGGEDTHLQLRAGVVWRALEQSSKRVIDEGDVVGGGQFADRVVELRAVDAVVDMDRLHGAWRRVASR